MTKTQAVKNFLKENTEYNEFVFHCPTLETAQELVRILYTLGYHWDENLPYNEQDVVDRWHYKKKNCIAIGSLNDPDKERLYTGRMGMYVNQGRVIVEVKDLLDEANEPDIPVDIPAEEPKQENDESTEIKENEPQTEKATTVTKEFTKICPSCCKENLLEAKFCTFCGNPFSFIDKPNPIKATEDVENVVINESPEENVKDVVENESLKEDTKDVVVNETLEEVVSEEKDATDDIFIEEPEHYMVNNDNKPILCRLLGVSINEKFKINNSVYNAENTIFRINCNGFREKLVGEDTWFISTDEQELVFLIENPEQIVRIQKG